MIRVSKMSSQVLYAFVVISFSFLETHQLYIYIQFHAGLRQQVRDVPAAPAEPEAAASVLAEAGSLSACMNSVLRISQCASSVLKPVSPRAPDQLVQKQP